MASPIIHLQRHVQAIAENNAKPYAVHTIRDGALRPITNKQLKDQLYLQWAPKEAQAAQKDFHNIKIKTAARALQFSLKKQGVDVHVDWNQMKVVVVE